jgi:hypothetical protein
LAGDVDVNARTSENVIGTETLTASSYLQVSYAVSPLICFAVVGALKASQAAVQSS